MKLQAVSQFMSLAGLLLPSFANANLPLIIVDEKAVEIASASFSGAALRRLAELAKNPEGSSTEITVICTLASFHLGQVCRKIP